VEHSLAVPFCHTSERVFLPRGYLATLYGLHPWFPKINRTLDHPFSLGVLMCVCKWFSIINTSWSYVHVCTPMYMRTPYKGTYTELHYAPSSPAVSPTELQRPSAIPLLPKGTRLNRVCNMSGLKAAAPPASWQSPTFPLLSCSFVWTDMLSIALLEEYWECLVERSDLWGCDACEPLGPVVTSRCSDVVRLVWSPPIVLARGKGCHDD
jgi:hypothetical protein